MTSRGFLCAVCALLTTAVLLAGARNAHALSQVDCETAGFDYADDAVEKTCEAGDASTSQWRGSEQVMEVQGSGYYLWVRRLKAGYYSYIAPTKASDVADDVVSDFQSPVPVKPHGRVSGYDIATFGGTLTTRKLSFDCFAFTRSGGLITAAPGGFDGEPGYAHLVVGIYCAKRTDGISDATMQHVLTELRAPLE